MHFHCSRSGIVIAGASVSFLARELPQVQPKKKKVISEAGESRTESRPWQEKVPLLRSWREGADLSGLGNKWGL